MKNGSERVVDEARQHIALLKMLKQFHYIDQNGKDQGVNVRNRAQELAKLLTDVDAIRADRKKARANRNKFRGVEGGAGLGGGLSSSSRYGGFGSETGSYGGYQGEVYGDGGGYGGRETDFSDTQRRGETFEEYDEETEGAAPSRTTTSRSTTSRSTAVKREAAKPKEPEQDLFDFGDEPAITTAADKAPASTNALADLTSSNGDDDFDDFQSATGPVSSQPTTFSTGILSPPAVTTSTTTSATQFAAPKPVPLVQTPGLQNLLAMKSPTPTSSAVSSPPQTSISPQPVRPSGYQPSGPNYYTSVNTTINASSAASSSSGFSKPAFTSTPSFGSSTSAATLGKPETKASKSSGGDAFGSLWSSASVTAGIQNRAGTPSKGPDLASLAKAKSSAGIWGAAASTPAPRPGAMAPTPNAATGQNRPGGAATPSLGNGLDDLLG